MSHWVKAVLLSYLAIELVIERQLSYEHVAILLAVVAITICKERFVDSVYLTIVLLLLACAAATVDLLFAVLFAVVCYDFMLGRRVVGVAASVACTFLMAAGDPDLPVYLSWIGLSCLLAYVVGKGREDQIRFNDTLDNERRLRYELERAKAALLHSSKEIAGIAEVKERNRIARDIHDSIGHSIAGILMQLQAAYKLHDSDETRSMEIVRKSIDGLAESVDILRKTVHNIKPSENLGAEYIRNIADNYGFCPVELKLSGDYNSIPAAHLELISTNMKEALTNAARYSQATKVDIAIDANERYTRLYIKDNGVGCPAIKEGLGLSGMKERVRNLGGTITVSANDGFLIVCVIPRQEGSGLFESANRG
ncbi:sensor histidine kinase [Cohnella sp. AR92]|uniref:sensor histidine kinase n=1 Tax=Cohnella sp. AR92 TaxID=648716 RepID=UPI000F8CE894|nr:sensor histidine kinase [Cohnella sp. AR92]RUS47020.1 sensor histidine kinase [Cohnella sp. AR92]